MARRPSELLEIVQNGLWLQEGKAPERMFDVRERATGKLLMIGTALEVTMRTGIIVLERGKLN